MAHTRGFKGGGETHEKKSLEDKHTGRSIMDMAGMFSFCCYRLLINFMARIQLEEVNEAIEILLPEFNCTLTTMPGIDRITAANVLSEIGEIPRFPNANKLAKFAGISPVNFSSARKGKDVCPKQGNRRLQAIFYFMAIQMIQISTNGTPRNKVFHEYYLKRVAEGKNKQQALICVSRRLVNIVYWMLKNHTEYREPE